MVSVCIVPKRASNMDVPVLVVTILGPNRNRSLEGGPSQGSITLRQLIGAQLSCTSTASVAPWRIVRQPSTTTPPCSIMEKYYYIISVTAVSCPVVCTYITIVGRVYEPPGQLFSRSRRNYFSGPLGNVLKSDVCRVSRFCFFSRGPATLVHIRPRSECWGSERSRHLCSCNYRSGVRARAMIG